MKRLNLTRVLKAGILISGVFFASVRLAYAMGETSTLSFLPGEDSAPSAVIDPPHTFAYFGTNKYFGFLSSHVEKVRLSDFTLVSTISVTVSNLTAAVMDSAGNFAYFGSSTNPAIISKVDLTSFAETNVLALLAGQHHIGSGVIDSGNTFAYFGTMNSPGVIAKIRLSDFTQNASLTLAAGQDELTSAVIDRVNGFAYFGTHTVPGQVIKLNLFNFTVSGTLTLQSGEDNLTSAAISTTTGYAYFGTGTSPGKIIRVRLSDFTEQTALTLNTGEDLVTSAVIDSNDAFAYFGTNTSPGKVIRVRLSDFKEIFTTTLASGEDSLLSAVIDTPNNFAYFGAGTSPGQAIKLDLLDIRTGPPVITAQPADQEVNPGGTASFSVTSAGSAPFTYQWRGSGVAIAGATSSSYTTGALSFPDDGSSYDCVVTNALGSATTQAAVVTVIPIIKVYPNPWRSDQHSAFPITFDGAAPNSTLKIFTVSMHWVASRTGGGAAPLTWDRTNDAGQRVASGYYFYIISTSNNRQSVHGKLAIIK